MKTAEQWGEEIYKTTLKICLGEDISKPTASDLTENGMREIQIFKEAMSELVKRIQDDCLGSNS